MELNKVYIRDALAGIGELEDRSVQCCVTSPPYYRLRDYGVDGQVGQEETPELYVGRLIEIFRALWPKLKDDGTLWCNLGDSYAGSRQGQCSYRSLQGSCQKTDIRRYKSVPGGPVAVPEGYKPKDLLGIPWMVAFALRADGWYLRQDIIWHKPNCMPEPVKDRCTKAHEYIFLLSKSPRYYFDNEAIKQTLTESSIKRLSQDIDNQRGSYRVPGKPNGPLKASVNFVGGKKHKNLECTDRQSYSFYKTRNSNGKAWEPKAGWANRRSVWSITTKPSKELHFAMFPTELPSLCIMAGSAPGDLVLDPFAGGGTTLLAASSLDRRYIGFDLNPKYVAIAVKRLKKLEGLFYRGP